MCRKLTYIWLLLMVLNLSRPASGQVSIIGSWVTGGSHTKEPGSNRLFIVIGHAEGGTTSNPNLSAVTYGGQTMTKIAAKTQTWDATNRAYVAVFILNEPGVAAASSSTISATWSGTSSNHLTSVFLGNVDQANIIGDVAVNGVRTLAAIATSALATSSGDMVIAGITCTGTGSYTPNNGFTEGAESPISNADGCAAYKSATGAAETPSVTHSTSTNHQAMVGLVVQAILDQNKASHPVPGNGISGVSVAAGLSWDAPAAYPPTSYDVYFGTNPAVRSNPKYTVYTASYTPPEYLAAETTYYWAVDSNNAGTIYTGGNWSFTTYVPIDGDLVADYILSQPLTTHYASACSYYGVLVYSQVTGDTALKNSVIAAFPASYYNGSQMPPEGSVDENAYGILPFELYRQTGDANYLTSAVYLADEEFNPPRPDGLSPYTRFWIDDTYMVGSLQAQAYKSMANIIYANRAVTQLLGYMGEVEQLQQPNGLFYHTLSAPIHWGRGNGWGAAAMTEVLLAIPQDHPQRAQLLGKYQAMMAGLVTYQGAGGMWYQALNMAGDPRNWEESSCTGMFIFALATGVREGWLPEEPYKKAAFDGWAGLTNYVDSQGRALQVCMWMSQSSDVQYYLNRPREIGNAHAQAAVIWAATAMELLLSEPTPPVTRTLSVSAGTGGTVTTPGIGSYDYNDGENAGIVASANANYHFVNWTGSAVTAGKVAAPYSNNTTVLMDANYTVQANFALNQYTVTVSAGSNGTVAPSGAIVKDYGSNQCFTATPGTGYEVDTWYLDGSPVQTGGISYCLNNISANHTVLVTFKVIITSYKISGYVRNDCNVPIEGIVVDANNGAGQDTTDSAGYYEIWVNSNWSGTITPTKQNYTFVPALRSYTNVLTDFADQNYAANNVCDLDCDGLISWGDISVIADNWLENYPTADISPAEGDGIVNFLDFAELAQGWMK